MSEQNTNEPTVIATGTKVKDPRRVAAGKRLAAISKQAKEAKRSKQEAQQNAETETGDNKTLYLVGGILVVGAASYLLFMNKKKVIQTITEDKEEPTPKKENFKSVFDD